MANSADQNGTTPLIEKMQDFSKQAKKAGYPRGENGSEMMTDRAQERAMDTGAASHNKLLHGRPEGRRSIGGTTRAGKYGMTVK